MTHVDDDHTRRRRVHLRVGFASSCRDVTTAVCIEAVPLYWSLTVDSAALSCPHYAATRCPTVPVPQDLSCAPPAASLCAAGGPGAPLQSVSTAIQMGVLHARGRRADDSDASHGVDPCDVVVLIGLGVFVLVRPDMPEFLCHDHHDASVSQTHDAAAAALSTRDGRAAALAARS